MQDSWTNKKVDKFVICNIPIGKGTFGVVYRGYFAEDQDKSVAVKVLDIKEIQKSGKMLQLTKNEINILQQLKSKYIVKLYDVARTANHLYMFFEYCKDGDLSQYIKDKNGLSESEALEFLRQIITAYKELFSSQIIHRDIKPANILLSDSIAKISDFGFSRIVERMDEKSNMTRIGSPLYMAPQLLANEDFSPKCDVWSLGVTFYQMLYLKTPWDGKNQNDLLQNIKKKPFQLKDLPPTPKISEDSKQILLQMLQQDEDKRIGWQDLFNKLVDTKNIKEIPKVEVQDELQKLLIENHTYLNDNLVSGYLNSLENVNNLGSNNSTENQKQQQSQQQQKNDNQQQQQEQQFYSDQNTPKKQKQGQNIQQQQQNDPSSKFVRTSVMSQDNNPLQIADKQKSEEKQRKGVLKVNEYILYERNIAMFLNYTLQLVVKLFNQLKFIKLEEHLYYRLIFCICKNQRIQLQKINTLIQNSQSSSFKEKLWQNYIKSEECEKSRLRIQNDILECNKLFNELFKRTKDKVDKFCGKLIGFQKEVLINFKLILDNQFEQNMHFKAIYPKTLQEGIDAIIKQIDVETANPDILVIIYHLIACKNPYKIFQNTGCDFNKHYDSIQHPYKEDLIQKINAASKADQKSNQQ